MSAFQQALANANAQSTSNSGPSMSIRGTANGNGGGPSGRGLTSALRQAGMSTLPTTQMQIDGNRTVMISTAAMRGRGGSRAGHAGGRGPLDQTGRHRPAQTPYGRNQQQQNGEGGRPIRTRSTTGNLPSSPVAGRASRGGKPSVNLNNTRRQPVGTQTPLNKRLQDSSHAKLSAKLGGEDMKDWLKARFKGNGVMDMSQLNEDAWLTREGILSPGDKDAPMSCGTIFWRLLDTTIQQPLKTPIYTLSLAKNGFHNLKQLNRLPYSLPNLRALDLSDNPIEHVHDLDELLAFSERKGKATAGAGGLKSLIELKLNGCKFREQMLAQPKGDETYQHEILRRFPSLLVLDGVKLNRIVFELERRPKVRHDEVVRARYRERPFSFPADVKEQFVENDIVKTFVMQFCAKFFPMFDNDRASVLPAYDEKATISLTPNTLISRSYQANKVQTSYRDRPRPIGFEAWTGLPGRNFLRNATSITQRMKTLKSPMDVPELLKWWSAIPKTKHPLTDPSKWCIDAWVIGGEGVNTKLCAMIQGEFQEMPSETFRSFSRTFILADAPQGSSAQLAGWPAMILSDIMVVHAYFLPHAFDSERSIAKDGVTIVPPSGGATANDTHRDSLITQIRARTGMNVQFATMCLEQNGWVLDTAIKNFEEIKGTIPPEAFQ